MVVVEVKVQGSIGALFWLSMIVLVASAQSAVADPNTQGDARQSAGEPTDHLLRLAPNATVVRTSSRGGHVRRTEFPSEQHLPIVAVIRIRIFIF